ncbi:MAG: nuclease [Herminiimonas sp.]|nr:nuclease [Herminiimonas sp.]
MDQPTYQCKRCTGCGVHKPLSEYFADSRRLDGKRAKCKGCFPRTGGKQRPEKRAEGKRRRGEVAREYVPRSVTLELAAAKRTLRAANAERRRVERELSRKPAMGSREWYASASTEDVQKYRHYHRMKYQRRYERLGDDERARATIYKHANPDKLVRWGDTRKRLMAEHSDGSLSRRTIRALLSEALICPYCRLPLAPRTKTLDHVKPLNTGGMHSVDNVAVCCKACNLSKGAKPLLLWMLPKGMGPC